MTDAATFATEKPNRRQDMPNKKRLNQIPLAMVSFGKLCFMMQHRANFKKIIIISHLFDVKIHFNA